MDTKYFATTCEFTLHEDDWNEGEGDLISRWDEADCLESSDSIKGILEQVNYLRYSADGVKPVTELFENDPCQDKEYCRFDADIMVDVYDEEIVKPSEEKIEKFKKGECKLYALHICVYIHKQEDLNEDDTRCWKD